VIKAVVFDLGGVFASDPTPPTCRKLSMITGIEYKKLYNILKDNKDDFERGKQSINVFWKSVRNILKSDFDIDEIEKYYIKSLVPLRRMVILVKRLRKKYKVGMLSNTETENFTFWRKRYSFDKIFDVIVTSFETGSRKPEEKIYKIAIKELDVKPNEIVFIDNQIKNVKGASRLGIHTIHYKSYEDFIKKLNKIL
jgi:epoxide hydrolase-like predicted phosphatase